jgi:hypothetical protein
MLPLFCQVSHYPEETAIRIDSNLAEGGIPNTNRAYYARVINSHLWYSSGWARTAPHSQGFQWPGSSGLLTHLPLVPPGSPPRRLTLFGFLA